MHCIFSVELKNATANKWKISTKQNREIVNDLPII